MPTINDIRAAIQSRVTSLWSITPLEQIAFDGVPFDGDEEKEFVRVNILFAQSVAIGFEGEGKIRDREPGLIVIQCFAEERQGSARAFQLAEEARNLFQYKTFNGIRCLGTTIDNIGGSGENAGKYQANARIACEIDHVISI